MAKMDKKRTKRNQRGFWVIGSALAIAVVIIIAQSQFGGAFEPEPVEEFMHIHGLAVPTWAPDELYVSTHQGLVKVDGDGKWYFVSKQRHDFMGFAVHPTKKDVLYSSGHPDPQSNLGNPLGFMVSRDSGTTWKQIALQGKVDFHALAVYPGDGDIIYGWNSAGGLYHSKNGGRSWDIIMPARELAESRSGAQTLAVHPDNPERLLAGTNIALLESQDGGQNWRTLWQAPATAVAYSPQNSEQIYVYIPHPDVGLMVSDQAGAAGSWRSLGFGLSTDAVGYIAIHPEREEEIYLGTFGESVYRTTDGGETWEQLAERGIPFR